MEVEMTMRWIIPLALALSAVACKKDEAPATPPPAPKVVAVEAEARPAQPKGGAPLMIAFVHLEGEGEARTALVNAYSYADKAVRKIDMSLRYLDAGGKLLKTFPWSQFAPGLVPAGGTIQMKVGASLPPETTRVEAVLARVEFEDGSGWKAPSPRIRSMQPKVRPVGVKLNAVRTLQPMGPAAAGGGASLDGKQRVKITPIQVGEPKKAAPADGKRVVEPAKAP
jgi:hypothetical protein